MMIKAVLFDFDGVIAQTETYKLKQLMLMLDRFQVAYTKEDVYKRQSIKFIRGTRYKSL